MNADVQELPDADQSPFVTEYVMVLCAGFRYMAYRDEAGRWRNAYDNYEIRGRIEVLG